MRQMRGLTEAKAVLAGGQEKRRVVQKLGYP
jgi:hypothetical protein